MPTDEKRALTSSHRPPRTASRSSSIGARSNEYPDSRSSVFAESLFQASPISNVSAGGAFKGGSNREEGEERGKLTCIRSLATPEC